MSRPARMASDDVLADVINQLFLENPDLPHEPEVIEELRRFATDKIKREAVANFKWEPVGIKTFIEGPQYLNRPNAIYPRVMAELEELNNGQYVESVLTGGIGSGKTTAALYTQAYQLYLLSCYRQPHAVFDLDPASEIVIIFQSLNASLAETVDYARFRSMLADAPYFKSNFAFNANFMSEMRFPNRIIVKPISGQETGAIGQNVIGGIIDEIDFMAVVENSKVKRDGSVYDQAVENYNSIARRRESRFMQKGTLPGMLCLVSSKNYPGGMTDRKQAEARDNPRIFVYDKRIYEVAPERFRVFVGDEFRKPRVLEEDDVVQEEDEALIARVPVEFRQQFDLDTIKSIRDIAGYSTQTIHPFMMNKDAVAACFGVIEPIASRTEVDFQTTFVEVYRSKICNLNEPRFAHIDLSLSRDNAGVAIGHVESFKHCRRGDYSEQLPVIAYDLILEVRPPRGGEIEFENIRRLLYNLRDKLGIPIKWVSFDQYQSADSQQILTRNGFMAGYQSMDTDTGPYDLLKQAFYDGRVKCPKHDKALKECLTIEFDPKHQKIDHPPQGSKDVSDAMAGVAFGLTMRRELWSRHEVSLNKFPASLEKIHKRSITTKEQTHYSHVDRVRAARGVAPVQRTEDNDVDF